MSETRKAARQGDTFFRVKRDSCALLVIDMQNAFLEAGAMLEVPAGREIIPRLSDVVSACRNRDIPVIWIQLDSSEPFGGMLLEKYPPLKKEKVLYKGTHSFELYADMPAAGAGDYHIIKHKYDAFYGTDLDSLLRNLGADTLIITGVTTNCCCESTARSAFERDYRVAFTSDGTAAFEQHLHEATLASVRELFGRVLTINEVIEEIKQ